MYHLAHEEWDFPGKRSHSQRIKSFLAPSLLAVDIARGIWGGIHLKTQVQHVKLILPIVTESTCSTLRNAWTLRKPAWSHL